MGPMIYSFEGKAPTIHPSAFIAEDATIIGDVTIGEDANIWPGVVIRGDVGAIRLGARVNVQDGSVLHVDTNGETLLDDDVTVGHLAMVHGCHVEPGCHARRHVLAMGRCRKDDGLVLAGHGEHLPDPAVLTRRRGGWHGGRHNWRLGGRSRNGSDGDRLRWGRWRPVGVVLWRNHWCGVLEGGDAVEFAEICSHPAEVTPDDGDVGVDPAEKGLVRLGHRVIVTANTDSGDEY